MNSRLRLIVSTVGSEPCWVSPAGFTGCEWYGWMDSAEVFPGLDEKGPP